MRIELKIGLTFLIIFIIFLLVNPQLTSKCSREEPPVISDIQLQTIDKNTVKITWRTDKESYGDVYILEQNRMNGTLLDEDGNLAKYHWATFTNLSDTKYVFEIWSHVPCEDWTGYTAISANKTVEFRLP